MLEPAELLDHGDRLLAHGASSKADIRRAISAFYYALFHLLTLAAARCLAGGNGPALEARIRRSAGHNEMRRVCEAMAAAPPSAPKSLAGLFVSPPRAELTGIASTFVQLQVARHAADYDLDIDPSFVDAIVLQAITHEAFADWAVIKDERDTLVFLAALLFADRWTRRG